MNHRTALTLILLIEDEEDDDFISDVDSEFDGYIDVDPCVSMLHDKMSNGSLSREHIFLQVGFKRIVVCSKYKHSIHPVCVGSNCNRICQKS